MIRLPQRLSNGELLAQIREQAGTCRTWGDDQLRTAGLELRYDVLAGMPTRQAIPRAFGLVTEAARRTIGLDYFDVQLLGGVHLALGRIAEMKTGEGKTLTAVLPVYLHALSGKGAHVATVNDYLAGRDAKLMGQVYHALGLSVGVVQAEDPPEQRRAAYQADVTYGTLKEFGFDFLRDRLANYRQRGGARTTMTLGQATGTTMRELHFILVDEADSNLIDEARTPLIIGVINEKDEEVAQDCYRWAAQHAAGFDVDTHFRYDHKHRSVRLSPAGIQRLRSLPETAATRSVGIRQLCTHMENAIRVERDYHLDRNYVLRDGEIVIVDEFTGRPAEGRKWQQGLHQAVEAKEQVEITPETKQGASITVQTLARLYRHSAGMTGTAWTSRREFRKVYKMRTVQVPTNRPVQRVELPVRILGSAEAKWSAIADETRDMLDQGRAVLIGTRTVHRSEAVSALLTERTIPHQVLNARFLEREAEIVAQAGEPGRVTVATNMAGRGTDIMLEDSVREAGGLHVILTELHESRRIDWQLIGRGSRQGDPGSYRIFVSLEDEILLRGLGPQGHKRVLSRYQQSRSIPPRVIRFFRRAQDVVERRTLVGRMVLLRQDKDRRKQLREMGQDPFVASTQ